MPSAHVKSALLSLNNAMRALNNDASDEIETLQHTEATFDEDLVHVLHSSDFVCRTCERYPAGMLAIFESIEDASHQTLQQFKTRYQSELKSALEACDTEAAMMEAIRQYRHLQMARIACLDLLHKQDIVQSMHAVSALADELVSQTYMWLFQQAVNKHGLPQPMQHLQIMAMGKLGGHELNFSSDIDLIFAYQQAGTTTGHSLTGKSKPLEHQVFFTRVAQKLIYALDHITEHGRCYRVDMRLRPLGESGPLVMSFAAFESYYQEQGRAWERFAMQKMRIINPDHHSDELHGLVQPFVYRRYVDFTTLDAIREMKHLIEKEVRRRQLKQNIKLGKGGIREVEFYVQALQLIHAGREPQCQLVSTLGALKALTEHQFIDPKEASTLESHYCYLRTVEHYLQMFNDQQTQVLPDNDKDQQRLCTLLSLPNFEAVLAKIETTMLGINDIFMALIADTNETIQIDDNTASGHTFDDLWDLDLSEQEAIALFDEALAHDDIVFLRTHIHEFKQKLEVNAVSERGLRSINRLLPVILNELSIDEKALSQAQVRGVFGILLAITGRTTYVDLLLENPMVRKRLYDLSIKSHWVAEQIALHPMLLDELLQPVYLQSDQLSLAQWKSQCQDELRRDMLRIDPEDIEAVMDGLRQFKNAAQLRIAAADLSGTLAINQVSDKLTLLAEVILERVLDYAWQHTTQKYGTPQGQSFENKGFGIAAYGKFGGIELSYGSDLDIVCLYDADRQGETDGLGSLKKLSTQDFYIKLVQRLTHLCITKCYHGILYEIDLRLRPSGNSGLLISHVDSFAEYQSDTAWTWEHQALVRARYVIGGSDLQTRFDEIRKHTLARERDIPELRKRVFEMREKMREHLNKTKGDELDVKQCSGGIVDIEFIVQFWVLAYSCEHSALLEWSDNLRLLEIIEREVPGHAQDAAVLAKHYLALRHVAHRIQLSQRSFAYSDEALTKKLSAVAQIYHQVFEQQSAAQHTKSV
jgi:glutamate-ammonia-ligase adenylyltransferase